MSAADLEALAIELYAACFEQYDRHRRPFADHAGRPKVRDAREAWTWLSEEQRKLCRAQAGAAVRWMEARGR